MKKLAISLLLGSCLYGQNVVTDWATIIHPYLNTPPKPPWVIFPMRAQVQLAVYDAVMAIEPGFKPYAAAIPAPSGADVRAAVATAAYRVARPLVIPAQSTLLDARYEAYMAGIPDGAGKTAGIGVGQSAAAAIQGLRANDGSSTVVLYECRTNPPPVGRFEPDGGCNTQPLGVNGGQIRPFTLPNGAMFRPLGIDPMTSLGYLEDFNEVRDLGRANSTIRTAEQTDIAYFWQVVDQHGAFVTLATSRGLNVRDTARYFALVYTTGSDAVIAGFDAKYYFNFWRPRTAIPLANLDGNPETAPDATWTPLISVNHAEYPSGHSFITSSILDATYRFFGTSKLTWTYTAPRAAAPQLVKTERTYTDLGAIMREVTEARIYAGLHYRRSMQHGAEIGRKVAAYVYDNFFQPQ